MSNENINITLPDGTILEKPSGITGLEIAEGISSGLAKQSILVEVNDELRDLSYPILEDSTLKILKKDADEALELIRHDCAHVMAEAVQTLFPGTQVTIGPAIDNGFYYDFSREDAFTLDDLEKIEKKMHEIIDLGLPFEREVWDRKKAIDYFEDIGEIYKSEIIKDLPEEEEVTIYRQGEWMDLCRGPHLPTTKHIGKSFKLMKVAGAYWRGDENNEMLTRIYGTAWRTDKELRTYLNMLKEAEKRDHRKIGKEMKIFTFDDEVGAGLPLWLPNGSVIIEQLENLAKETEDKAGYDRVRTPHITKGSLYEKSGHLSHYRESMFPAMDIDGNEYFLKPMNCPHHHKIFDAEPRSYRDLPLRLAEYGQVYRFEDSGAVSGLVRVRGMCMNDAHIYCTEDQIKDEFKAILGMYQEAYSILGLDAFHVRLSKWDPEDPKGKEKYVNNPRAWERSEQILEEVLEELEIDFKVGVGEGAFYGPKIDIQFNTVTGREESVSTVQLDFAVPGRMGLTYTGSDGEEHTPYCIHRAPFSTHERMVAFLIEHFGGAFPTWLAPIQVQLLTVSEQFDDYAKALVQRLRGQMVRAELAPSNDTLPKKIRQGATRKIPNLLIIGEREVEEGTVTLRRYGHRDQQTLTVDAFEQSLLQAIKERAPALAVD